MLIVPPRSNEEIIRHPERELFLLQDQLSRCGLHPKRFDLNKVSNFVDKNLQSSLDESPAQEDGGVCHFSPLEAALRGTDHQLSELAEHESQLYSKAMQVFCDIKSKKAFETDYVWPSLEMHRAAIWKDPQEEQLSLPAQAATDNAQEVSMMRARN